MIKASELRIGNCVHKIDAVSDGKEIKYSNRLYFISAYDIYHIVEDGDPTNHPIPLTPEWLERCGLELREKDKVWQIQVGNTIYLEIEAEEPFMCGVTPETWRDLCPIYIWADVKSVHQLQNLFYSLAGKELTIKQ